ncbi:MULTISPECIES: hypothetical protein [unclassified Methanoculleus]|jgi:hypothetical protein|uniref:hypothetical protein n=1 Tax=unclassified Methanoculleus TaxID=2619537 RepID=UPI0025F4710E|nr:hypothetical protein [Methanoculleus sp. UBA377]MDD2473610.1 hypothetical protein [Methanoculleus sp.]
MRGSIAAYRKEQETRKGRVREMIAASTTYGDVCKGLEDLGFRAREDNPALALWENPEYELFVIVRMNPETGRLQEYGVSTFEEAEGSE